MCHAGEENGENSEVRQYLIAQCKVIKSLERESYKYLGVLEADEVMVNEMKDKVKKEH